VHHHLRNDSGASTDTPGPSSRAHEHLRRVIEEFGGDPAAAPGEVVIDLTDDAVVVVTPTLPTPPAPATPVAPPVLNRARYRRSGIAGVSARPGELSELATLVDGDSPPPPNLLRLVLAARRRHPEHPAGAAGLNTGPEHPA
jgi:hypothetical protein